MSLCRSDITAMRGRGRRHPSQGQAPLALSRVCCKLLCKPAETESTHIELCEPLRGFTFSSMRATSWWGRVFWGKILSGMSARPALSSFPARNSMATPPNDEEIRASVEDGRRGWLSLTVMAICSEAPLKPHVRICVMVVTVPPREPPVSLALVASLIRKTLLQRHMHRHHHHHRYHTICPSVEMWQRPPATAPPCASHTPPFIPLSLSRCRGLGSDRFVVEGQRNGVPTLPPKPRDVDPCLAML